MPPRYAEMISETRNAVAALNSRVEKLEEQNKTLLVLVRDIKRSIVRKYGEVKEENAS